MELVRAVVVSLRPKHWGKNCLVFALPLSDGLLIGSRFNAESWLVAFLFFMSLSFMSSCNYIMNDILDREHDVKHPTKKQRPIASGVISIELATSVAIFFALLSLTIGWAVADKAGVLVILGFGILQFLYSVFFKNYSGFDIVILSSLYVIRCTLPYIYETIPTSRWFLVMIFAGALFLSTGKRLAELSGNVQEMTRPVLKYYTQNQLLLWIGTSLTLLFTSYLNWIFTFENESSFNVMILSLMPALIFLIRITASVLSEKGEDPTKLFLAAKQMPYSYLLGY